jgi:23S rRNA (pseudouridine1915-N3)-methyltransferase
MLRIRIVVVDRTRSGFLKQGESFYLERLRKYVQVEWVEVKPAKIPEEKRAEELLAVEAERISRKIGPQDYLVSLDRSGRQYHSEGLASWVQTLTDRGERCVTFAIGGSLGLSKELLQRSQEVLSLSRLTFTHEMSRLIFLEQLYRAFTILRGEKYHK